MIITSKQLAELEALGFEGDVLKLEDYVMLLQDAAADGEPIVEDNVYDHCVRLLKELKPESEALNRTWEKDYGEIDTDLDKYLDSMGMKSITTCVSDSDLRKAALEHGKLGISLEYFWSVKLNGHAFRAVYRYGKLVKATSRGRYKVGRDMTRHLKILLPNTVEAWEDIETTEVRGELVIKQSLYEEELSHIRKSPLSSVTSISRDSATDDEIKMLDAVCYKLFQDDFEYSTLEDEFETLMDCGFQVPTHGKMTLSTDTETFIHEINSLISELGQQYKAGTLTPFNCDGVVIAINNNKKFYSLGPNGNAWSGNIAVKMGQWECSHYVSTIESIEWCYGKKWITPKAHIVPVKTAPGATVSVVPLYNVANIVRLHLIPGSSIHFRFGGETGVQLLTPTGESVTTLSS